MVQLQSIMVMVLLSEQPFRQNSTLDDNIEQRVQPGCKRSTKACIPYLPIVGFHTGQTSNGLPRG